MRTATHVIRNVVLALFVLSLSIALGGESHAARYLKADITVDGKTVLEGGTGDDGEADADEVWNYLKEIRFEATEDFPSLKVDVNAQEVILTTNAPKGRLGITHSGVVVTIRYGGKAVVRDLTLVRVPSSEKVSVWRVDPTLVDRLFDDRFIRRSDAAGLKSPRSPRR